jgi:hypothetical protein
MLRKYSEAKSLLTHPHFERRHGHPRSRTNREKVSVEAPLPFLRYDQALWISPNRAISPRRQDDRGGRGWSLNPVNRGERVASWTNFLPKGRFDRHNASGFM